MVEPYIRNGYLVDSHFFYLFCNHSKHKTSPYPLLIREGNHEVMGEITNIFLLIFHDVKIQCIIGIYPLFIRMKKKLLIIL